MATSTVEWKLESAWIAVMGDNTAFDGYTVKRWGDISTEATYPCIMIQCTGSESPDWDQGWDEPVITMLLMTEAYEDKDYNGSQLGTMIGAVRDLTRSSTIKEDLTNAVTGLTVRALTGINTDIPILDDQDDKRIAVLEVKHRATCFDYEDEDEDES